MICSQTARTSTPIAASTSHILNPVRRAWRRYWDWRARRMTVAILQSLDARTLRDIGISAGEIESVVHGQTHDRTCRYNVYWRLPA
jgi:uncharacterized protein YjiS (DUF1127 family)